MKSFTYKQDLVYEEYMCIPFNAYHEKIRFYESRLKEITQLPFEQYTDIRMDNAIALFEVGAYEQYIRKSEDLIRLVISENIYEYRGKDAYKQLLYYRAMSYYRTVQYDQALHIFRSLLHMEEDKETKESCFRCLVDKFRSEAQALRGISIMSFIFLGVLIAFELLLVRSFYINLLDYTRMLKILLATSGFGVLVFIEIRIRMRAHSIITKTVNG